MPLVQALERFRLKLNISGVILVVTSQHPGWGVDPNYSHLPCYRLRLNVEDDSNLELEGQVQTMT